MLCVGALTFVFAFSCTCRRSEKPFLFVWNMIVPGPPTICCVFVFGADNHPDELGSPPDDPEDSDWQPFDFLMWRWVGQFAEVIHQRLDSNPASNSSECHAAALTAKCGG